MATVIDSYDGTPGLFGQGATYEGQCFTNTNRDVLDSCVFYLSKFQTPTGNATAQVYAITGTFGTNAKPTGSVLATSGTFNVATLTGSFQQITFTFSGADRIILSPNTKYAVLVNYTSSGGFVFLEYNPSGTHAGNSFSGPNFNQLSTSATNDHYFYVYTATTKTTLTAGTGSYTTIGQTANLFIRKIYTLVCGTGEYIMGGSLIAMGVRKFKQITNKFIGKDYSIK